jgi:hypothetical protein
MDWTDLAQDRDWWQAIRNVVMNLPEISLLGENPLTFQEGLCSMK